MISFYNGSGEEIPPNAVMQISAVQTVADRKIAKVVKPNLSQDNAGFLLNGNSKVPIGKTGQGIAPVESGLAYYNNAATPGVGETWGPSTGSWKLSKGGAGYVVIGGAANERVQVRIAYQSSIIVKMTNTVGPGTAGTATVQQITNTPPIASGTSITIADASPTQIVVVINFRPNYLHGGIAYIAHKIGASWVVENDACFQDFMS